MSERVKFEDLVGMTLDKIVRETDQLIFHSADGRVFKQCHSQYCCESVDIEDICGDLEDAVGTPILEAVESTSYEHPVGLEPKGYTPESFTWTFYRIRTIKGEVTIRWFGVSNGYYSESVDFVEAKEC